MYRATSNGSIPLTTDYVLVETCSPLKKSRVFILVELNCRYKTLDGTLFSRENNISHCLQFISWNLLIELI